MEDRYRFLEHTADAKFRAYGKSLEEAFSNAAIAMTSIMLDISKINKTREEDISVEGTDQKSLLYNFLEELLFLLDTEGLILAEVISMKINGNTLRARITGDTISERYKTAGDVKAVTYNDMEIIRENNKYVVQVVVDL